MPWSDPSRCSTPLLAFLTDRLGGRLAPERYRFWYSRAERRLRWRRLVAGQAPGGAAEAEGAIDVPADLQPECAEIF